MKYKYIILMIVAPVIFVLDQLTKFVIVYNVLFGDRIPVISGYFDLVHFRNTGAAFGFLAGAADSFRVPFFYTVAILAVCRWRGFFSAKTGEQKDDGEGIPVHHSSCHDGGQTSNDHSRMIVGPHRTGEI